MHKNVKCYSYGSHITYAISDAIKYNHSYMKKKRRRIQGKFQKNRSISFVQTNFAKIRKFCTKILHFIFHV